MSSVRMIARPSVRLARAAVVQNRPALTRALHTSDVRYDFFSWLKDRKKSKKEPVKSTKEVISEIESGNDVTEKNDNVSTLELIPENFIGTFDKKRNVIPLDTVPFNRWMNSDSITTEEALNKVILDSYNEVFGMHLTDITDNTLGDSFKDITQKFKFTKLLQVKSGYILSDYQFTILASPNSFKEYYLKEFVSGKSLRFKESEPNAIHLDGNSFKAPNIRVIEDIPAKDVRIKYKKLVTEVNELENKITADAIENAKQS